MAGTGGAKSEEGYAVRYPDGYMSWSPKETFFEEAYRPSDCMTFGLAIEAAKKGQADRPERAGTARDSMWNWPRASAM